MRMSCGINRGHEYQALPRIKNGTPLEPRYHECPICALEMNSNGHDPLQEVMIAHLRRLHADSRVIVHDPVAGKMLSGPSIVSIAANGPAIQISLHPHWWPESFGALGEIDIYGGWHEYLNDPDREKEPDSLLPLLRGSIDDWCLGIWEPVSQRFISGSASLSVEAHQGAVRISLAKNWVKRID